jgi:hypothetical protein
MTLAGRWDELRERCRRAAELDASPWIMALALVLAALLVDLLLPRLPRTGSDLEQARQLGIISRTILQGYPKSVDVRGYAVGLLLAVGASVGLWLLWASWVTRRAARERRRDSQGSARARPDRSAVAVAAPVRRWHWLEWVIVSLLITVGFFKPDMARNGFDPWALLAEEGEMMAWVNTLLHGGVLSRDVFCLYGPLSVYPVAALFKLFGPSLWVSRVWIFALNVPALLAVYALLRSLLRTRILAVAGMFLIGLLCTSVVPAMSWSLSRVALGLGAIAAFHAYLRSARSRWLFAAGAVLGVALSYSQEVGLSAAVGVGVALLAGGRRGGSSFARWAGEFGWLAAGVAIVVGPLLALFAAQGALGATLHNLFIFPRVRMLGYAAYAFPVFDQGVGRFLSEGGPAGWEALRTVVLAYFSPAVLAVSAFVLVLRGLRGQMTSRLFALVAVLVFGLLLFQSPLSRPDGVHLLFALPPALVLLVCFFEEALLAVLARTSSLALRTAAAAFIVLWIVALGIIQGMWIDNLHDYLHQAGLTLSGRFSARHVPGFKAFALPRARGVCAPEAWVGDVESTVRYLQDHTRPDQPVWVFPNEVMINFLADRPLSNPYPLNVWGITREQRKGMVAAVERSRPPYAVFYLDANLVDGLPHQVAMPEPFSYLDSTYVVDRQFGRWLVVRRTGAPS